MKEYIRKDRLIKEVEDYFDLYECAGLESTIKQIPTVTDLDICKLFATRFIYIVKSLGKLIGAEIDDTTAMEIFNMMFSEMENEE